MSEKKDKFDEFADGIDRIIDAQRKSLAFVQHNRTHNCMTEEFYKGVVYAYLNIKAITKELRKKQ